jgi:hypothetical protein
MFLNNFNIKMEPSVPFSDKRSIIFDSQQPNDMRTPHRSDPDMPRTTFKEVDVNKVSNGSPLSLNNLIIEPQNLKYISANELLLQLDYSVNNSNFKEAGLEWQSPYSLMLIDVRSSTEFSKKKVKTSVNIHFLPLTRNRFKKKIFTNFSLVECLDDLESKNLYETWLKNDVPRGIILIYDNDCGKDSEVSIFYNALSKGLAEELSKGSQNVPKVAVLNGGLSELASTQPSLLIIGSENFNSTEFAIPTLNLSRKSVSGSLLKLPKKSTIEPNAPCPKPVGSRQSLMQLSHMNIELKHQSSTASMSSEDSSIGSAYDNAAPNMPYSEITANIFIGSDEIPCCPDAILKLQQLKVTHILNMAYEVCNSKAVEDSNCFKIKWIPVHDNTEQDMEIPLQEAIDFMSIYIH